MVKAKKVKEEKEKAKITSDLVSEIEELAKKLLELMGTKVKIKVSHDKENDAVLVDIDSEEETGLLIGKRGETLIAIQAALGMMVRQGKGEWVRIIVNVGDWREKHEDYLRNLASQAAERAKETNEPQMLYNLSPAQRRVVHVYLSEDKSVETESTGEDDARYLIIKSVGESK